MNEHDPLAPLRERGISDETIRFFGIRVAGAHWAYPVKDSDGRTAAIRLKRRPGFDGPKYGWDRTSFRPRADLLYAAETVIPGRMCILAEGEADVWVCHTAGLPACSLLAGAGSAPDAALDQLRDRAPAHVFVAYDNDEAGINGACGHGRHPGVVQRLRERGVPASALALPEALPEHGDLSDLFRLVAFDRERFIAALAYAPERRIRHVRPEGELLPGYAGSGLIDLLAERADLRQTGPDHWVARCLFHEERTPSMHIYGTPGDEHLHCFSCCQHMTATEFANWALTH